MTTSSPQPYTQSQLRAACAPLAETMSRKEIAEHFGQTFNRVVQAMIGLPRKPRVGGTSKAERAVILPQALKLRPTLSTRAIAVHFGIAATTLDNWFNAIDDARTDLQAAPKWARDYVAAEAPQAEAVVHEAPHQKLPAWPWGW